MADNDKPTPETEAAEGAAARTDAASASDAATEGGAKEAGGATVTLDELTEGAEPTAENASKDADGAAADDGATEKDPQGERITALEAEVAGLRDQLMRAIADVQNARKRADREKRDAETYGGMKLAREMLPVYDNLGAALAAASEELQQRESEFFNGVSLTLRTLVNAFEKHDIHIVTPERGDKFDPNLHQAMFEAPVEDLPPGCVSEVMQAGCTIADRLIRPALVGVSKAPAAAATGG